MAEIDIGSNLTQVLILTIVVIFAGIAVSTGSNLAEVVSAVGGIVAVFTEKAQFFVKKE
jgi:hypothetical protein